MEVIMKKAGVRINNEIMVSFNYDEKKKAIEVLVVDGKARYTGTLDFVKKNKNLKNKECE